MNLVKNLRKYFRRRFREQERSDWCEEKSAIY